MEYVLYRFGVAYLNIPVYWVPYIDGVELIKSPPLSLSLSLSLRSSTNPLRHVAPSYSLIKHLFPLHPSVMSFVCCVNPQNTTQENQHLVCSWRTMWPGSSVRETWKSNNHLVIAFQSKLCNMNRFWLGPWGLSNDPFTLNNGSTVSQTNQPLTLPIPAWTSTSILRRAFQEESGPSGSTY